MSKKEKTLESSIQYQETNLASLISERTCSLARKGNGEEISDSYLDRLDRTIADIENTIHNLRTKGRGYD